MSKRGANEEGGAPQQGANDPNKKDPNADLFETKRSKKVVRLITVVAYMVSVSFVAIVLSAYYLFLWVPPDPRLLRRPVHMLGDPDLQFLVGDEIPIEEADNFRGRIVDDDSNEASRLSKRHQILDQSLLMLKLYLADHQRNRTKHNNSTESISTKETVESETRSPTIPSDQANGKGVAKDQGKENVPASSPIKIETVAETTGENVTEDEAWPAKDVRNHRTDSYNEESSSTIGTVTFLDKSTALATDGKDSPRAMGNRPAINSTRKWKFAVRPELEPPSRAFASSAMNLKETQAEKTTVRSVPDRNQQTEEPEAARNSTMSSLRTNSSTTPTGFLLTEEQNNVLKHSNVDSGFLDNSNNGDQGKRLTNTSSEND
ncbi:uncharacterized protein LOC144469591 [Augochlora pura]